VGAAGALDSVVGSITLVCIEPNTKWVCTNWSGGDITSLTWI
jgi:hypothetical protein